MKRTLGVLTLASTLAGCDYVTPTEFEQHVQEYQALRQSYDILLSQLTVWGDSMYTWGLLTGDVICEVARTNRPITAYPQRTQDYCGPTDPGNNPPAPPMWGQ
jgi:hypothetical protein